MKPARRLQVIVTAVRMHALRWWTITLGFTAGYYALMLLAVVVRFGSLPNFAKGYDWPGNVVVILESTPSLRDAAMIIGNEWLLEVGFMNYEFGHGIAEWSLFLLPGRLLGVLLLGALLATRHVLVRQARRTCAMRPDSGRSAVDRGVTGFGAGCVALSSITLSWVVCCSTPTWVVGLAMLGLGVSTALWLEPLGAWLTVVGYVAMLAGIYGAVRPRDEKRSTTFDTRLGTQRAITGAASPSA